MKQFVSVMLALVLFAGVTAFAAKGKTEPAADVCETVSCPADEALPVSEPQTAVQGTNLPVTQEDLAMLERIMTFLDLTEHYDSERDDGERFICCGIAGEAVSELCAACGVPTETDTHTEQDADPLSLMPHTEDGEGNAYWFWYRIDAEAVDYLVRNVFHTCLNTPGDPEDTILQGYYYLDGYYYINAGMGGSEGKPQIVSCEADGNGRCILQMCRFEGCADDETALCASRVEAALRMVDGRRMWTIFSICPMTDRPALSAA